MLVLDCWFQTKELKLEPEIASLSVARSCSCPQLILFIALLELENNFKLITSQITIDLNFVKRQISRLDKVKFEIIHFVEKAKQRKFLQNHDLIDL